MIWKKPIMQTRYNTLHKGAIRDVMKNDLPINNKLATYVKKAGAKLNAPTRDVQYTNSGKMRKIMKKLFSSQFNYSPLMWMFHNR